MGYLEPEGQVKLPLEGPCDPGLKNVTFQHGMAWHACHAKKREEAVAGVSGTLRHLTPEDCFVFSSSFYSIPIGSD